MGSPLATDGLIWPARQTALQGASPPACPRCHAAQDTLFHRLWQCGALSELRQITWDQVRDWAPCTFMHGLIPKDFRGNVALVGVVRTQAFRLFLAADTMSESPQDPMPLQCPTLFAFKDRSKGLNPAGHPGRGSGNDHAAPTLHSGAIPLKRHSIRAKTQSAWECTKCGRLNTGTWTASRHAFLNSPCAVAQAANSKGSADVRLSSQLFLNDVRLSLTSGRYYVILGHEISYEPAARRIRCRRCVRHHPVSKLSKFLQRPCA